jgi:hypothetical protein
MPARRIRQHGGGFATAAQGYATALAAENVIGALVTGTGDTVPPGRRGTLIATVKEPLASYRPRERRAPSRRRRERCPHCQP